MALRVRDDPEPSQQHGVALRPEEHRPHGSAVQRGEQAPVGAELGPDAFLMKGSEVPPGEFWGGNPAVELSRPPAVLAAPVPLPRPRDAAPTERPRPSVEDLMSLFQEDGAPDAPPTLPVPRRSGRHRATQRHLAGSR